MLKRGLSIRISTAVLAALLVVLSIAAPRSSAGRFPYAAPLQIFEDEPRVRVLLGRAGPSPWSLDADSDLVVELPDGTERRLDASSRVWIAAAGSDVTVDGTTWNAPVRIRTADASALALAGRSLRGTVVFDGRAAERPVLHVELETYVAQILPGEMPLAYPEEALVAQGIATRSYAVSRMTRRRDHGWDLTDGESSQVLRGRAGEAARAARHVRATRGLVLAWGDAPLPCYFSSNCGGRTRGNGAAFGERALPPLRGGSCGHCSWSRDHEWSVDVSLARLRPVFGGRGTPTSVRVAARGEVGYDATLAFTHPGGRVRNVPARRVRALIGFHTMKSTLVTGATIRGGRFRARGRGFGHGVGLCQNGARGLAELGRDARAILEHYYPDAEWRRLAW